MKGVIVSVQKATPKILVLLIVALFFQNCARKLDDKPMASSSFTPPPVIELPLEGNACVLPDGSELDHAQNIDLYNVDAADCGEKCISWDFVCNDGGFERVDENSRIMRVVDASTYELSCSKVACDARTVNAPIVSGLKPQKPYLVSVYGVTHQISDGIFGRNDNVQSVKVTDCNNSIIAETSRITSLQGASGVFPQSANLSIEAPDNGQICAETSGGEALSVTVVEQKELGVAKNGLGGLNNTYLMQHDVEPGSTYLISNYGRGGFYTNSPTLNRLFVSEVAGSGATLAETVGSPEEMVSSHYLVNHIFAVNVVDATQVYVLHQIYDNPYYGYWAHSSTAIKTYSKAVNIVGGRAEGLIADKKYFAHVFGVSPNRVSPVTTLKAVRLVDCDNNSQVYQALPDAENLALPQRSFQHSAGLVFKAPPSGCAQVLMDGKPLNMTLVEID